MDTARYKAFLTAAETGSLSRAAEIMNYTPSGVSQLITALEQELALSLLKRSRKGVSLTAAGEELLPAVRDLLREENRIYQIAGDLNQMISGEITVASYASIAAAWLPLVISKFHQSYPNIRIHILEGNSRQADEWLENRKADLAFYSEHQSDKAEWFPLQDISMQAILPAGHPLASEQAVAIEQLKEEELLIAALGNADDVDELLERFSIPVKGAFSAMEGYSVIGMIEQGLGVGLMNELIAGRYQADVVKLPLDPPQKTTFGIGLPSYADAAPAVRKFVDFAIRILTKEDFA